MALITEADAMQIAIRQVANDMLIAARTAPKGKGVSNLELCILEGDDIIQLSKKTKELGEKYELGFFLRDAENILDASLIVLAGTKLNPLGIPHCGLCGFENCAENEKNPDAPCIFNTGDLGIAVGSAASVAMDRRVDNRIMYSVGKAAVEMGLLGEDVKIAYAIPLSVSSKNPFFDRKPK